MTFYVLKHTVLVESESESYPVGTVQIVGDAVEELDEIYQSEH